MKIRFGRKIIDYVKKPFVAMALSCVLISGPFGCSRNLKQRSSPIVPRVEQISKVVTKERGKDIDRMKSAIQKEIREFESEIARLRAMNASGELDDILARLAGPRQDFSLDSLKQLETRGSSLSRQIKAALSGKAGAQERLETLVTEAKGLCAQIRSEFEKARILEQTKTNDEISGLKKRIRWMRGNRIRRILYRQKRAELSRRMSRLEERLRRLGKMKAYLDPAKGSQAVEQRLSQTVEKVRELRRALEHIQLLEKTIPIQQALHWLQGLREVQERRGLDSSLTKMDISERQAKLKEIEKAAGK